MHFEKVAYIPALKYRWLDPLFDPGMRYFMREGIFKGFMVEHAALKEAENALDVGCGTGTLALLLKKNRPSAQVIGIDMDPWTVTRARSKSKKVALEIELQMGTAVALPYSDEAFDVIVTTLVFHHLSGDQKEVALREMLRVLRPGGRLLLADFGSPTNVIMRVVMFFTGLMEDLADNLKGLIPRKMEQVGFADTKEARTHDTPLGTISIYEALKPPIPERS